MPKKDKNMNGINIIFADGLSGVRARKILDHFRDIVRDAGLQKHIVGGSSSLHGARNVARQEAYYYHDDHATLLTSRTIFALVAGAAKSEGCQVNITWQGMYMVEDGKDPRDLIIEQHTIAME